MNLWVFFLSHLLFTSAHADTLQKLVTTRLKEAGAVTKLESEQTWASSAYIPIQFFEYRYSRSDENKGDYRVNLGGETQSLRIHIKSHTEILSGSSSRKLSRQLLDAEQHETVNQRQFDVYSDIVEQALQARVHNLLSARGAELQKSLDHSGQLMGLAKANVKDLVSELDRLKRVDSEYEASKVRQKIGSGMAEREALEAAAALIENVNEVAKQVSGIEWNAEMPNIERKRIETKLSRIDKEIGWAEDRKIVDSIDLGRNTFENEDTVRVIFNVPFLRFDNENRARDKALLAAKESSLEREAAELRHELRRKKTELLGMAAQVESLKSRLNRTRGISNKIKGVRDIELRSVLGDFSFELERDVLMGTIKFYTAYLEFLRDQGAFASYHGRNILAPNWPGITL